MSSLVYYVYLNRTPYVVALRACLIFHHSPLKEATKNIVAVMYSEFDQLCRKSVMNRKPSMKKRSIAFKMFGEAGLSPCTSTNGHSPPIAHFKYFAVCVLYQCTFFINSRPFIE